MSCLHEPVMKQGQGPLRGACPSSSENLKAVRRWADAQQLCPVRAITCVNGGCARCGAPRQDGWQRVPRKAVFLTQDVITDEKERVNKGDNRVRFLLRRGGDEVVPAF